MAGFDPACVKTRTSRKCAELFSPFSSFDYDYQCCSFPIQCNRGKISTRKFDVGVFTEAGPKADIHSATYSQATSASKRSFLLGGRELLPKRLDVFMVADAPG